MVSETKAFLREIFSRCTRGQKNRGLWIGAPQASSCTFYDYNETMQTTSIAGSCQPSTMVIICTSYEIGYTKDPFHLHSKIDTIKAISFCSLSETRNKCRCCCSSAPFIGFPFGQLKQMKSPP